jgi:ABC-type cobalt transport system substrate-binding protein
MTNDEAMLFGAIVMIGTAFIIIYLIGQDNDK